MEIRVGRHLSGQHGTAVPTHNSPNKEQGKNRAAVTLRIAPPRDEDDRFFFFFRVVPYRHCCYSADAFVCVFCCDGGAGERKKGCSICQATDQHTEDVK
jgi:hypothetical protein